MFTMYDSALKSLPLLHKGKVRDIYGIDDNYMLIVTTDRLSAFDVVLPDPVPNKGKVLTALSLFWGKFTRDILPNHFTNHKVNDIVTNADEYAPLEGRAIIVRKLKALPIEAIVRGYLVGSGWKDYQQTGTVCGIDLPTGLQQASQLPEPLFTPSTKAAVGEHDQNVDFTYISNLIGNDLANEVKNAALQLYVRAREYAATRGIIIADTKFEFGVNDLGELVLIDEVLTPDSSRFWPAAQYQLGISPPSFDKQFVRDYLETLTWNKKPPVPSLPIDIIEKTSIKYQEAQTRLMS
jgi:phosphoribosylaminoimidazole-succinocarboxamide synthase